MPEHLIANGAGHFYEARRWEMFTCYDCAWVGNRPKWNLGVVYGFEQPWDEAYCPECGETVCDVLVEEQAR